MADDTKSVVDKNMADVTKAAEPAAEQPVKINLPKAETLPVNQVTPTASASAPATPELTPTPPVSQSPEAPLVVSEAEIKEATEPQADHYADEVETLTGEVQALEARIDRLTNNVEPTTGETKPAGAVAIPQKETPPAEPLPQPTEATPPPTTVAPNAAVTGAKPAETKGVNDIYAKVAEKEKSAEAEQVKAAHDDLDDTTSITDVIGTISDIISVFGVVVFIILMVSPFIKSYIGTTIYDAMRSVGWLAVGVCMAVAFLLSFAIKGKWATKIMLLLFLLLTALMWLGINRNALVAPLETYLGQLFNYYR
ncbi:MAG TPA: hypothetical protein VMQ44_03445 [Candidatus Saccharimonadales bacterium]|nr:hypothetical protein [Candidatus Saccharimonadales bacterium]